MNQNSATESVVCMDYPNCSREHDCRFYAAQDAEPPSGVSV